VAFTGVAAASGVPAVLKRRARIAAGGGVANGVGGAAVSGALQTTTKLPA
jgi:hypothetical protein